MRHAASAPCPPRHPGRGFSLVEIAVVLAVSALLALLAVPGYLDQLARSRRSDATAALQRLQWAQQRHHQAHGRYAERLAELRGVGARSEGGHYRLELLSLGHDGYAAMAHAEPSQARDRDCPALTLQVDGAITQRRPSAACWGI